MGRALTDPLKLTPWERFKAVPREGMAHLTECFAHGMSLRQYAHELGVAVSVIHDFIHSDAGRAEQYARARELRADYYAEVIATEADTPVRTNFRGDLDPADVARKRLKVDALKWTASKLAPKRYGEKLEVDATVTHDVVGELRNHLNGRSKLPLRHPNVVEADAGGNPLVRERS